MEQQSPRAIAEIAREIKREWKKPNYAAEPYLNAMCQIYKITDRYGVEDARGIVAYFLANCGTFKGEAARRLKDELRTLAAAK